MGLDGRGAEAGIYRSAGPARAARAGPRHRSGIAPALSRVWSVVKQAHERLGPLSILLGLSLGQRAGVFAGQRLHPSNIPSFTAWRNSAPGFALNL